MRACIVGAGPHGRVILDILRAQRRCDVEFADDNETLWGQTVNGARVTGSLGQVLEQGSDDVAFIIAVGNPTIRLAIAKRISERARPLLNAVHPSAVVMQSATMGEGNMIGATAVINSGACLGRHTIVNTGAVVEHDCTVSDGAAVSPGAHLGGRVTLGYCAFVSTGAIVLSRVSIGAGSIVAAGAVVTRDVPEGVLVMGVPARVRRCLGTGFDWKSVL
jgi:sugar O-acyltransferase (sialic acid O-acetyltransferase NeuD family)